MKAIAAGGSHTCALLVSGAVKCWGKNVSGQLGNGSLKNSSTPVPVVGLSHGVVAVDTGEFHSCALTNAGAVKCWGLNDLQSPNAPRGGGQLGTGNTRSSNKPVDPIGMSSGTVALSLGSYSSCALSSAGGVKCWGDAGSTPTPVPGLEHGIASIDADDVCAVTTGGALRCGWPPKGVFINIPQGVKQVSERFTGGGPCAIFTPGGVKCYFYKDNWKAVPRLQTGVASISTGKLDCALMTNHTVKCWGNGALVGDGKTHRGGVVIPVNVVAP